MGVATSLGMISSMMLRHLVGELVGAEQEPPSAVTRIRNGNSAISADSAMWLAVAQPSLALKRSKRVEGHAIAGV
jgi:hypothetical protein